MFVTRAFYGPKEGLFRYAGTLRLGFGNPGIFLLPA
jgi:hypothetical protein